MQKDRLACGLVPAPAFASFLPLQLGSRTGLNQRKTTVARAIIPDNVSTISPRLLHARILLHLLQLSRQKRRSDSETEGQAQRQSTSLHADNTDKDLGSYATDEKIVPHEKNDGVQDRLKLGGHIDQKKKGESYSSEERLMRSERLRAKWRDPVWRENILAKRRSKEALLQKSESLKNLWKDEEWRSKMRQSRLGREAPNKGVSPSAATRLRMSVAQKGRQVSEETRRRMSLAKINRPQRDEWRKLISDRMKGKTREYFAMRREYRALRRDLKLWSDSYRAKYGVRPRASTYERFVAPMMALRIRRYLILKETLGSDNTDAEPDIISQ